MAIRTKADEDREVAVGDQVRLARLSLNIDQATVARRANVSLSALKSLEQGRGSTLLTVIRVLRALGRDEVLNDIYREQPRSGRYGANPRERSRASARTRDGA